MKGSLGYVAVLISLCSVVWGQDVVIHEIMYHPESGSPDEEFLELANISASAVNLAGWKFTRGVSFEFPSITIAPGGYLVVAANKTAFEATYEVSGALGDWTGSLSNRGERLTLEDASGEEVFDVIYSDEGDWADRVAETDPEFWREKAVGNGRMLMMVVVPRWNCRRLHCFRLLMKASFGDQVRVGRPQVRRIPRWLELSLLSLPK